MILRPKGFKKLLNIYLFKTFVSNEIILTLASFRNEYGRKQHNISLVLFLRLESSKVRYTT